MHQDFSTTLPRVPDIDPHTHPAWTSLQPVDPLAPYVYDGCSDIEFPIHTSPDFALKVGLPGIILQGTATLAYAVRELVNNEAGGDPESVREIACTFTGMVIPGTDIEICCLDTRNENGFTHIFFEVINAENKKADLAKDQGYVPMPLVTLLCSWQVISELRSMQQVAVTSSWH